MRVKVVYRKNLKMSEGKVAAQVAHAIIGLNSFCLIGFSDIIVVLRVSDKKFKELLQKETHNNNYVYIHADFGYTEVVNGEETCAAWIEEE